MIAPEETLHLLLVEDDEDDYVLTRGVLAELPETRCTLDWVTTFEAALEMAAHGQHDAYLVDYQLGAHSGLQIVQELIAQGCTAPIIMLTGESDRRVGAAAMAAGAADYLVKNQINAALLERSLRYARARTHRSDLRDQAAADAERARLRALIMEAPSAIALWRGREYHVELANSAYITSVGTRDVIGRPVFAVLPELAEQGMRALVDRVWVTGEPWRGKEMPLRLDYHADGAQEVRYFDTVYQPLRDTQGGMEGILVHAVDVTEGVLARQQIERQTQEMAAQAEERAAIIEQMPSGVVVLDAAGRMVLMNDAGRRISGSVPDATAALAEQADTYGLREPGTGRLLAPGETPVARALAGAYVEDYEYTFHQPGVSGETWVSASAAPLRAADGEIRGAISVFSDVTHERQLRQALKASEERFAAFMDASPTAAFMKDEQGRYVYADATKTGWFHRGTAAVLGKTDAELWPPEIAVDLLAHDQAARAAAEMVEQVMHLPTPEGDLRYWLTLKFLLPEVAGQRLLGGIALDITERLEAEEALRLSEARLRAQFQGLPVPTYTWQRRAEEWILVDYNQAADVITQGAVGSFLGTTAQAMYGDKPAVLEDFAQCWAQQATVTRETPYRFETTGVMRDLVVTYVPVPPDLLLVHTLDVTERTRAATEIQRHLGRLSALHTIDMAITASLDLPFTLSVVLEQVTTKLGVDAAHVLVLNEHTQILEHAAARGFEGTAVKRLRLRLGQGLAGRAALERSLVHASDLSREELIRLPLVAEERFVACYAVPLIAKGQVQGVLEVFHRGPLTPDGEWLDYLETLAGQTAIAIDNALLFTGLQRSNTDLILAYDTTIEGWSRALDLRDKETEGHSQRVTEMSFLLARTMGMDDSLLMHARRGALLHDIGKMGVPDAILLKPGPLTDEEWVVMRHHPTLAYTLLAPITHLRLALDIPYCHHEKWDGTGYPRGLVGEQIPLPARIFAVVDVWDALTSDRPYRAAWPGEKARAHIQSLAGTHFDPAVVAAFLGLLQEGSA